MLTKCVGEGMGKLIRNNQVQVAEVLPLYAKGTGQQGVCWDKSSLNIEIKKITGWRNNRKIDWYEDVFLLCYANHYIVEGDKQNVLWVAQSMSFTRLTIFFPKIYRPYEQSDMQTGTDILVLKILSYCLRAEHWMGTSF